MQPKSSSAAREQRLSSSSSSPRKPLRILFHCWNHKSSNHQFNFYIVHPHSDSDSSPDEYLHMTPNIQFKASKIDSPAASFCSLNSTLYMFQGDLMRYNPANQGTFAGTFAGKFALTPEIISGLTNHDLEKQDLIRTKPMNQPKICPIAVPTPDRKHILVFSEEFYSINDSFELYDIDQDTWTLLPKLPLTNPYPNDEYHYIGAYGFQSKSCFVVQIDRDELAFALNLQTLSWEIDFSWSPIPYSDGYFLGSDKFAYTPYGAYDVRHGLGLFLFDHPITKFPTHLNNKRIALSDDYDGAYELAVVRAQEPRSYIRESYKSPFEKGCADYDNLLVILDICRIDHVRFERVFEEFNGKMEKYVGRVHESLPDMPSFDATRAKTPEQFTSYFGDYKRELESYMEECMLAYEGKGRPFMPLVKTTVDKTLKLLVGFDFASYTCAMMHVFSI